MAEFVESESDFPKVKNTLVTGSIHIGSPAENNSQVVCQDW